MKFILTYLHTDLLTKFIYKEILLNAHANSFKFAQSKLLKLFKGIFFVMIIEKLEKSSKKVNHTF